MPSVDQNYQVWNERHSWSKDGDEWSDQATFCGQPYDAWKQSLIETFMLPYITDKSHVLEIGPGHGRWTKMYVDRVRHVSLVDLSPSCIEHCKTTFGSRDHIDYFVTDGKSLNFVADHTIDFIWSYDVFVHIEREETRKYFTEFARILKADGAAVIHHPDVKNLSLRLKLSLLNLSGPFHARLVDRYFSRNSNMGRSFVSSRMIRDMANRIGFKRIAQTDTWGPSGEYNCRMFGDEISVLRR
jgi:ubiquinone/menaquinone biosynthesis C-methylase UbiE